MTRINYNPTPYYNSSSPSINTPTSNGVVMNPAQQARIEQLQQELSDLSSQRESIWNNYSSILENISYYNDSLKYNQFIADNPKNDSYSRSQARTVIRNITNKLKDLNTQLKSVKSQLDKLDKEIASKRAELDNAMSGNQDFLMAQLPTATPTTTFPASLPTMTF